MRYALSGMALLLIVASATHADDEYQFADNLGDDYLSAVNAVARQLRQTQSVQIEKAGKLIARQLLDGKDVFVYDRHDALWTESRTRAGGLPGMRPWRPLAKDAGPAPGKGDLLLCFMHALSSNETNLVRHVLARGARAIVVFPLIPSDPRTLALLRLDVVPIDSCSGTGRGILVTRQQPDRYVGSVAAPAALLTLWALLTEATQQMLAEAVLPKTFASDLTEAGRTANAALLALAAKERFGPLERAFKLGKDDETLAGLYLSQVYRVNADMSGRVIFPEKPPYPMEQAVDASLKAAKAGRVFHWDASPVVRALTAVGPGRPAFVQALAKVEDLKAGDVLWLGDAAGGSAASVKLAKAARGRGATVITYAGSVQTDNALSVKPVAQVHLALGTPAADGIIAMPETERKIGPVSTIVQVEAFWMLALRTHQKLLPKPKEAEPSTAPAAPEAEKGPFGF